MKKHVVRAPQTDRYGFEVPCSAADLDCSNTVIATETETVAVESSGRELAATEIVDDPKSVVTSQSPLTISPRVPGLYMAVVTVRWDALMAYADRALGVSVLVNGSIVGGKVDSGRFGASHWTQTTVLFRVAAGDAVTFEVSAIPTTTMNSAEVDLIQVAP